MMHGQKNIKLSEISFTGFYAASYLKLLSFVVVFVFSQDLYC
jgi:uncharacterized protein YfbU (UPF0304 family)